MKFLKLSNRHYVRYDAIQEVKVVGSRDRWTVELILASQDRVTYRYCKNTTEAESVTRDLVRTLTDLQGATMLYDSASTSNDGR